MRGSKAGGRRRVSVQGPGSTLDGRAPNRAADGRGPVGEPRCISAHPQQTGALLPSHSSCPVSTPPSCDWLAPSHRRSWRRSAPPATSCAASWTSCRRRTPSWRPRRARSRAARRRRRGSWWTARGSCGRRRAARTSSARRRSTTSRWEGWAGAGVQGVEEGRRRYRTGQQGAVG